MADYHAASMVFVDGENLTLRGQTIAKEKDIELVPGTHWQRDTFLWFPDADPRGPWLTHSMQLQRAHARDGVELATRAYYYTSVQGDEDKLTAARLSLRGLGFEPNVFKKTKGAPSKGVDISLTTDVISLAHRGAYQVAYLLAGDGDYVPLVEEVKRIGARVIVVFFEDCGLSDELRIVADDFVDLTRYLGRSWEREAQRREHAAVRAAKKTAND